MQLRNFVPKVVGSVKDEVGADWNWNKTIKNGSKVLVVADVVSMNTTTVNLDFATITKPTDSLGYGEQFKSGWVALEGYTEYTGASDDINNIGKYKLTISNTTFWVGFAKGTSLATAQAVLVGKTLNYQLAIPKTYMSKQLQ